MSRKDWIDGSIRDVESSVDAFHESFKEFTDKCDSLIEHLKGCSFDNDSVKKIIRESQIEALEEILDRFTKKEFELKNVNPEVAKMMKGFRGVIEVWRDESNVRNSNDD